VGIDGLIWIWGMKIGARREGFEGIDVVVEKGEFA
jgi:hypothetical protein